MQKKPLLECVLQPGDVLYMPRGFVHEAFCPSDASSWHATLAVATHDWSWTKVAGSAMAAAMDRDASGRWRTAVPLTCGVQDSTQAGAAAALGGQLEELLGVLRQAVSPAAMQAALLAKTAVRNAGQDKAIASFAEAYAGLPSWWPADARSKCVPRPGLRVPGVRSMVLSASQISF